MDDRIKQIIGSSKNVVSIDTDTNVTVSLNTTTSLVKTNANPINSIIGVDDQFNLERDESTLYRMLGRLNIITANELTKGDINNRGADNEDWDPVFTEFRNLNNQLVKTPNNWLIQICYPSDKLESYPVWGLNKPISLGMRVTSLTGNNPSGNRSLLVVTTTQKHKLSEGDYIHLNDRVNTNQYQGIHKVFELGVNGEDLETKITLETSWNGDLNNEMFLNRVVNPSDSDILFLNPKTMVSFNNSDISGGTINTNYITVTTTTEHELGINDYVEMRKVSGGGPLNGFHRVTHVIDDFKYTIKQLNTFPSPNGYEFRVINGTPSDYYVREFELLTGNDYDLYNAAFSSSIYPETVVSEFGVSNKTWLYHFNKDIDTHDLISHRGGIVNELKICFLKRSGELPFNWSNVTSHWEFNYKQANTTNALETVSKRVVGGVGSIEKNARKTPSQSGEKYIGDIVEYNRYEIKEKIITEVVFRFGVHSGVITNNNIPPNPQLLSGIETITTANPNLEGYYYKPFKTMDIKKFSIFIENAEPSDNVEGIPADYEVYSDGSMSWRNLLSDGFIEDGVNGVNWPFLNGRHYIYTNNILYVRRQNPYVTIDQSNIISINPKNSC